MADASDVIILGLSGGPDSVCLLDILLRIREELRFGLAAVCVNHGLREEAEAEEYFVKRICDSKGVPLLAVRKDVKAYREAHGLSPEEAGREVRRQAYEKAMAAYGGTRIALGHHMDDQAETVLLNMVRGSGLTGLAGIQPSAGVYIRPLLCVRKAEILTYLKDRGLTYCLDHTNREDAYTRNRIRNHIIPYLEDQVNEKTVSHIVQLAGHIREAERYLEGRTEELMAQCVREDAAGFHLKVSILSESDPYLVRRLIWRMLAECAGKKKDIEGVHVEQVAALIDKQTGRCLDLPYGIQASREYGEVLIRRRDVYLHKNDTDIGRIYTKILPIEEISYPIPNLPYTKWFDYDIIQDTVVLRTRKQGDVLCIDRQGHTQKLQDFLVNQKIPREERGKIPLVACGCEILWVVGYRQNAKFQISGQTKTILEITYESSGGKYDG